MPLRGVIVDANVPTRSLLPSENPARAVVVLVEAALAGAYTLLLPPQLLSELFTKLTTRRYLVERISPDRSRAFLALLREVGEPLPAFLAPFAPLTRDPKDDYLLAYALRDSAGFLVSGDRDLLDLDDALTPLRIVDPGGFVRELRARGLVDR